MASQWFYSRRQSSSCGSSGPSRVARNELVQCPTCRSLITRRNLLAHIKRLHEKEREQCKNCGKSFSYGCLQKHAKRCNNDASRPLKCTVQGCGKIFMFQEDKAFHVASVHSDRVRCTHPGCQAVLKKTSLRAHVKNVHEKLRAECEICGKKVTPNYLSTHTRLCRSKQSGEQNRVFRCSFQGCDKSFRSANWREKHVSMAHWESKDQSQQLIESQLGSLLKEQNVFQPPVVEKAYETITKPEDKNFNSALRESVSAETSEESWQIDCGDEQEPQKSAEITDGENSTNAIFGAFDQSIGGAFSENNAVFASKLPSFKESFTGTIVSTTSPATTSSTETASEESDCNLDRSDKSISEFYSFELSDDENDIDQIEILYSHLNSNGHVKVL